jgi:drug/metabolite transporter (DMT)-like permease
MLTAVSLLVVVACSVAWSLFDLTRKSLVTKISPWPLLFYFTAGMLPLLGFLVLASEPASLAPGYAAPAIATILLNVVANLAFLEAIRVSPLSLTIPLLSFTPVFAAVLAMPLLGQFPTPRQWSGVLIVVAGAFVLNTVASDGVSPAAVWRSFLREKGAPMMLLVALLWAATISLDRMAVERSSPALHGFILCAGVGLAALIALVARRQVGELAKARLAPWMLLLALVIGTVALVLQLEAIQLVWVGAVETIKRGVGNALAVVFGRFFFGEPVTPQKVAAVLLMAVGVAVLLV